VPIFPWISTFFNRSNDVYGCWLTSLPAPAIHGVMRLDGFRTATELLLRNAHWQDEQSVTIIGNLRHIWTYFGLDNKLYILKVPPYIYINLFFY
jgi:hypothetical protein